MKKAQGDLFNERFAALVEEFEVKLEGEQTKNPLDCVGFFFPPEFSFFENRRVPPADFSFAAFGERTSFIDSEFGVGASFSEAEFGGGARFSRAKFGVGAKFSDAEFGPGASFSGAEFGKRASFADSKFGEGADFSDSVFGEGAWFSRAKFGEKAHFFGARFGKRAFFEVASFGEGASFGGAKFGEDARFDGATFGQGASFIETLFDEGARFFSAKFGKDTLFHRAAFGKNTSFEGARFESGASFYRAAFGDGADFRYADFTGSAAFEEATALGSLAFLGLPESPKGRIFSGGAGVPVSFERVRLDRPDRVWFSSANLEGVSFLNTDVTGVNFVDAAWPKDKNGNISFRGKILTGVKFEKPPSRATFEWLERLCQQLKLNFENKRNYADAGEFHFAEMEYRRRRYAENREWSRAGFGERFSALAIWLYKALAGYGERIGRAAGVLLAAFALVSAAQGLLGFYHAPGWLEKQDLNDPRSAYHCERFDGQPYRLLRFPPNAGTPCTDPVPGYEVFGHAAKFTLQNITFRRPLEYSATHGDWWLPALARIFFPIQAGLLLVAIRRRFRR